MTGKATKIAISGVTMVLVPVARLRSAVGAVVSSLQSCQQRIVLQSCNG